MDKHTETCTHTRISHTRVEWTHRLIDPLPRTRNLFFEPLCVFTPDLNRTCDKKWYDDNENDERDDSDDNDNSDERVIDDDDNNGIDEIILLSENSVNKDEGFFV